MRRIATVLLVVGCAASDDSGELEPVAAGTFDGYEVVAPCMEGTVGVIGRGAVAVAPGELVARGRALLASVEDIPALWGGGGVGAGCREGDATGLYLDDARYLRELVHRTGAFLHQHDLALQVVITLDEAPKEH